MPNVREVYNPLADVQVKGLVVGREQVTHFER